MHFLSQSNQLGCQIFCLSNFNDNLEKILILMGNSGVCGIEAATANQEKFRQNEGGG
jgi:hypothetical protein